jgi:putative transposase
MDRTVRLRLKPTPEQAQALAETTAQFTAAFNAVCAEGWRLQDGNAFTLHRFTYRDVKDTLPALVSDLHIQARQKASEAVKSALTRLKHGRKTGCPHSDACPPRYNLHTFKVDWTAGTVRLSTTRKKQSIAFHLPPYAAYALGCPVATADLLCKKGKWYLHVVVVVDDIPFVDNAQAIGVDMGVCRPAVTSDGRLHGKKRWRDVTNKRFRLKRKLQSNGSKSAKRHLRRLAGREQRFRRDCDHVLSKRILEGVAPGTTVVIENLTDIRTRVRVRHGEASRRLHSWSFAQLKSFLTYKAEGIGARVIGIDPRHTSQRCNVCGHIYRGNRPSQSRFICRKCGHKANPDINAARNIRDKHLVGWSSPSDALSSTSVSSRSSDQGQAVSFTGR